MSTHSLDECTIELIARRVAVVLRDELEAIARGLTEGDGPGRPRTVEDVAERFGVARSTVYAHWREWGGYKLGAGEKTAIRFPPNALPNPSHRSSDGVRPDTPRRATRSPGRPTLRGTPRLPLNLGDED
jgi:transposase-like protein